MTAKTRIGLAGLALALGLASASHAEAASTSFATNSTIVAHGTPLVVGNITLEVTNSELVVKDTWENSILWRSESSGGTCSTSTCRLGIQNDGHVIVFNDAGSAVWGSGTFTNFGGSFLVQDVKPYLNALTSAGSANWRSPTWVSKEWRAGDGPAALNAGDSVLTDANVKLELTSTANLVVSYGGAALWESGTSATCSPATNCAVEFTTGGNLRITGPSGELWSTGTATSADGVLSVSQAGPYLSVREGKTVKWSGSGAKDSLFSTGQTLIRSGETRKAGTTKFKLTTAGNFEARNAANAIVWQTSTSSACVTSTCRVAIQGDGNVILFNDSNAFVWGTSTYNNNFGALKLSEASPYITFREAGGHAVWSAIAGAITPSLPTASATRGAGTSSALVQSFDSVIGVGIHMDQYEFDATVVASKLNYLGLHRVRDGHPNSATGPRYTSLAGLVSPLKFNLVSNTIRPETQIPALASFFSGSLAGKLESIEGPNEVNNFSASYYIGWTGASPAGIDGLYGQACFAAWPNNCGDLVSTGMQDLKSTLAASSLSGVKVLDLTGGGSTMDATGFGLNVIDTSRADYGNVHVYTGDNQPRTTLVKAAGYEFQTSASNVAITEIGYTTDQVSANAQAILNLNALLDAYSLGYHKVFLYDLSDNNVAGWERYGLFDTAGNPKASATAIHNLTTILADSGTATSAGSLSWSITGYTGNSILLQKSGGKFDLILWEEPDVANGTTDVTVTPTSRTVNLGGTRSQVKVFDPIASATALSTVTSVSSVSVSLGSHPLVIEITP